MAAVRDAWTDERLDEFSKRVDQRFDEIDRRFDQVDRRFEEVDRRFEQVDRRFEALELKMENGFAAINSRFDRLTGILIVGLLGLIGTLFGTQL